MVSKEYSEAFAETLDILKHTRKEDVDKISKKFLDYLIVNSSKTYKPKLDHSKKLIDMTDSLSPKTLGVLSVIYRNFWCNEDEKKSFDETLIRNEKKFQEELRKKYNPDNIFKRRTKHHSESLNN